ncbi:hypothetical protein EVAR_83614_1 [Eumeta japonica]|uniref:Uncharacterized protein n=1 Tax=Eumeta variegata TaxID=151549 RepID=A0A4C1UNF4_EUMVA|nr:hypothetical protein EVAR_83614_1 [Eumeta japonica]
MQLEIKDIQRPREESYDSDVTKVRKNLHTGEVKRTRGPASLRGAFGPVAFHVRPPYIYCLTGTRPLRGRRSREDLLQAVEPHIHSSDFLPRHDVRRQYPNSTNDKGDSNSSDTDAVTHAPAQLYTSG